MALTPISPIYPPFILSWLPEYNLVSAALGTECYLGKSRTRTVPSCFFRSLRVIESCYSVFGFWSHNINIRLEYGTMTEVQSSLGPKDEWFKNKQYISMSIIATSNGRPQHPDFWLWHLQ